jgi:hypothetical protein
MEKPSMSEIRVTKILGCAEHIVRVAKKLQESPPNLKEMGQAMGAIDESALHISETVDDYRTGRETSQYIGVYPVSSEDES